MSEFALLGVGIMALAALAWFANHQVGVVLHKLGTLQARDTPSPAFLPVWAKGIDKALQEHDDRFTDLFQAVAEGIAHVDRNEKRVRGIVTGAKRRFAAEGYEDPGVEAEYDSLPEVDAGSGTDQGVLPLSNDVGVVEQPGSSWDAVPGMRPIEGA